MKCSVIKNLKTLFFKQVVKTCLCLQNGNAAADRSQFRQKNTVTSERTLLSDDAIMGLRRMKEYAKSLEGPIKWPYQERKSLLAHNTYTARKQEEAAEARRIQQKKTDAAKKEEEDKKLYKKAERKKEKLDEKEKKLDEELEKGNEEFLLAQELFRTASSSLSEAIKEENMRRIVVANELMSDAQKNDEESATLNSERNWKEKKICF